MAGVQSLFKWVVKYVLAWLLAPFLMLSSTLAFVLRVLRTPAILSYRVRKTPPAVLQNSALGTHEYARVGTSQLRLHYVASSGDRDKPLMVCLHGFPEFWYSFRHQLKAFGKDYRVLAVDMRGFGDSDKPQAAVEYKVDKMAGDIVDLIEALGYTSCTLVANDGGAVIAGQVATDRPDLVEKLVVMNGPVSLSAVATYARSHPKQMLKFWYSFLAKLPYLPEMYLGFNDFKRFDSIFRSKKMGCRNKDAFTDEDLEAYKYAFSQPGALTAVVNFYRANGSKGGAEPITAIRCPSLMIWGDQDGVLDTDLAKEIAGRVQGMKLEIIEGASHFVQQDFPDTVNRLMTEFLNKP
ncbi:epoxide hydrolase 4-like [Branchiostoma lanceolatum]|uniref:epoxide hydrolase 4-like n=1 Tax=Branchiostoma lanceolatum TaxID=7740 RepID=UPI003453BC24